MIEGQRSRGETAKGWAAGVGRSAASRPGAARGDGGRGAAPTDCEQQQWDVPPASGEPELSLSSTRALCCKPPDEQKLPASSCSRLSDPKAVAIGNAMTLSTIARNAATQAL
ncbi:hypothetical protein L682_17025 [Aquipseudomonas alcaligenes OT 69]|nr:hypothetical protein L682_17025 [Pseudomonas alcaligenes OT 69]